MSEQATNRIGRDYDIPIVWHEPAEFDMAEPAQPLEDGGAHKSPSAPASPVKKRPKATKRRPKR